MSQEMYSNFINFLKKYQLFDKQTYEYIKNHSVLINSKSNEENFLMGCTTVLDYDNNLIDIIPCFPFMKNNKMVAINVYVYVQTLMLLPNLNQQYEENSFNNLLPLLFFKLYILENSSEALLKYEKEIMNNHFKDSSLFQDNDMLYQLSTNQDSLHTYSRRLKRTTKDWVYTQEIIKSF